MSKGLKERVEEIKSLLYHEHYITGGYIDSLDVLALIFLRWHDKRIEQEKVKAKLDRDFLALICYSVWQDGNIDGWEEHKKETKHFGDCTNEPNTCHVCFTANMYKLADKIQSQLKESERK